MSIKLKKYNIINRLWIFRSLLSSIFFNFYYLPFKQAMHLPILLYKPVFRKIGGKIIIDVPEKKLGRGIIRLGRHLVSIYDSNGIMIENKGVIIFHGDCEIGSGCKLSVSETGVLEFGDKSRASAETKFICANHIYIGEDVGIGWETLLMDNDLHSLTTIDESTPPIPVAPIIIGDQTWIASHCRIMKGAVVPPRCVIASGSLLNKKYDIPSYSLLGGAPAKVLRSNIWRDRTNDYIDVNRYIVK